MTADSTDRPEPPYATDLLADLDAGLLDDAVAAHIRSRITDDPEAQQIMQALARTRTELHTLATDTSAVPAHVDARTQQTLAAIRDDVANRSNTSAARRRRWFADHRTLAVLGSAAMIVAIVAVAVAVIRPSSDSTSPVRANPSTSISTNTNAIPDVAAALTVLGKNDAAPFASADALRRCVGANGVPASTPVLGSGEVLIDGTPQVLILLSTGVAGRFTALVVRHDCNADNPATISRTTIGG